MVSYKPASRAADAEDDTTIVVASDARFDSLLRRSYIGSMVSKLIAPKKLPPEIARRFVKEMRTFYAESDPIKRDEIAMRQLRTLQGY